MFTWERSKIRNKSETEKAQCSQKQRYSRDLQHEGQRRTRKGSCTQVHVHEQHDRFTLRKGSAWLWKGIVGAGVREEGAGLLTDVFICKKISG